ncbi:MAG TPA: D-lyxose/D-mannose family sugar isomerase [Terrimicrobiaceae bacterium]|nr:D-lyxose/D-mannose family sugar isomerase [Terrimicrobiaceae bacterium]
MKRSEINAAIRTAGEAFQEGGWTLPPKPKWDVTEFGLEDFCKNGLVLVNLAEEPEYCEKLMFALAGQVTPMHTHRKKKEDIICRRGRLTLELWADHPSQCQPGASVTLRRNGRDFTARNGEPFTLEAGERVTLVPGIYHAFWGASEPGCIIGEVSTANDDAHDNFFVDQRVGRFPAIEEDEPALVRLVGEA